MKFFHVHANVLQERVWVNEDVLILEGGCIAMGECE